MRAAQRRTNYTRTQDSSICLLAPVRDWYFRVRTTSTTLVDCGVKGERAACRARVWRTGHGSKPGYTEESESGVGWEGVSALCTALCTELCSRLKCPPDRAT